MAITPEDIVSKQFPRTKFREGYDLEAVDTFLDEVVDEMRRLLKENEDLRAQLADARSKSSGSTKPSTEEPKTAAAPAVKEEAAAEKTQAAATPSPAPVKSAAATAPATSSAADSAAGVLAMAQQLHDDYVNTGVQQRDKIIAEAQIEASALVRDAQEKSRKTLGALEQQKNDLERKVEELRGFERDYRARLKSYIEGQLRELEERKSIASETAS